MKIIVIGLGQSLRGDDAAGLEAVHLWHEMHPQKAGHVQIEYAGLPGLELLNLLEGMDAAILVDAVQSSAATGTVMRLGMDELADFTPGAGFAHGWGVAESLQLGWSLYPSLAKCQVTLIGIVGKQFGMGASLSSEVQEALKDAAEVVEQELRRLMSAE